ncbi:phosphoribosylformylglycinamidine synthase I [Bremerella sp. JC817]|uniref:phosphoribosylformylglycinamidine synthase I n=1 Tax=Bremerella sp. JC817 TaxID=3231756 RepID=UPI003459EECB
MAQPKALLIRSPGTNCDLETAYAFEQSGAVADRIHLNRILEKPEILNDYQILALSGGFSYGDDISAGRIVGSLFRHHLMDAVKQFHDDGKLILGICNGFQILIKTGLLLADDERGLPASTLAWNDCQMFQDRWVNLKTSGSKCVFLKDIDQMYLPVAHAEGRFMARDEATLDALEAGQQLCLTYTADRDGEDSVSFPDNPNGAQRHVAGVCDETGRIFGLMPHPERYIDRTHHPRWTRGEGNSPGDGLKLFQNAVEYFA